MKALFALMFLAASARAGVVAPVEGVVAPAGPSVTAVPVLSPAGGSLVAPSWGADLRGSLPQLPAPVPGLLGVAHQFVGNLPDAPAAQPQAAAATVTPAPAQARSGRVADKTPALPAKASPGSPSLAISRDRKQPGSTALTGPKASMVRGDDAAANPLLDSSALGEVQPERAAGLGRSFFDRSDEKNRGELSDAAAVDPSAPVVAATMLEGGAFGRNYGSGASGGLSARGARADLGAGHGAARGAWIDGTRGETLHDAVASALPPGAAPSRAAVKFFGGAPNGELPGSPAVAALPAPGAPRPLSLDLSREGLIVRVRSALSGVLSAPSDAAVPAARRLAAPGPSTALIERGAMLEAFSVAGDYAAQGASQALARSASVETARRAPPVPVRPETAPLWWAWFALPLFVAAVRGIL